MGHAGAGLEANAAPVRGGRPGMNIALLKLRRRCRRQYKTDSFMRVIAIAGLLLILGLAVSA